MCLQGHEMIVNTLSALGDSTLFSAGYDGKVVQWNLDNLQSMDSCSVGGCINGSCVGPQGQVYVGAANGLLHRLDNK